MRNLYIIPMEHIPTVIGYCELWHGTELPSGEVLVSVQFTHDYAQREWESLPFVQIVGNEFDGNPIDDTSAAKLTGHGIKKGDAAKTVRAAAKAKNKLM
jgi:hypothetical protein